MGRRPGRPPKFVYTDDGQIVVGLSLDKANGNYYNTFWKSDGLKKENFGKDKNKAIYLFGQWEAERNKEQVDVMEGQVEVAYKHSDYYDPTDAITGRVRAPLPERFQNIYKIPESVIWKEARDLILSDPTLRTARKKLGLNISIEGDISPKSSTSLKIIGDMYFENPTKEFSKSYLYNNKKYWNEFIRKTGCKTIRDISIGDVYEYRDLVLNKKKRGAWGPSAVNQRFSIIKTIFNHASKHIRDLNQLPEIKTVQSYLERLEPVKKPKSKPHPISKKDYLAVLEKEDNPTFKAIWLLSLNIGARQTDLADIRKNDCDLEKGTLQKVRHKNNTVRAAMLWTRTIEALKEMQEKVENSTEYLFVNSFGEPLSPKAIAARFRKIRPGEKVKLEHLRDGTKSRIMEYDPSLKQESDILMGHCETGQGKDYYNRLPQMTKRAVAAVEQYYFSKE